MADCAVGVDVVALFTPAVLLLIADEFNVSLVVALFTFVAVTFGLFAVVLMLFRAIFEPGSIFLVFPFFVSDIPLVCRLGREFNGLCGIVYRIRCNKKLHS